MNTSAQADTKWQVVSNGYFYECGESTAIYFDRASGDTHLISDFAAYLLQRLDRELQPLDTTEIIELVRDEIETDNLPELSSTLTGILKELTSLDLVAPT